jgi:hypothetical protein
VRYFSPAATNTAQTPKSQLVREADTISYKFCALFYYFYTENQFKKGYSPIPTHFIVRGRWKQKAAVRMDLKKKQQ